MNWNDMASMTIVLGFLCTGFSYVIIKPLNKDIKALNTVIYKISARLDEDERVRQGIFERLIKTETKLDALHRRLDYEGGNYKRND